MNRFLLLLLIISSIVLPVSAQTGNPPVEQIVSWWVGKEIAAFEFEGLKNVSEAQLFSFKNDYVGRVFTDDLYLELYTALTALDYFDRFEVYPVDPTNPDNIQGAGLKQQVVLRFVVYENPVIDNIYVEGNKNVRKTDILASLISVVGDPFKRSNLRVDRKAIELLYSEKGYPATKVKSRFELDEENGRAVVFFEITEGVKRVVSDITFSGNTLFSNFKLKTTIELKSENVAQDGIFDDAILENDIQAIQALYYEKGYIRAKVVEVKKTIRKNSELNREELSLIFIIEEGDRYYFGGIDFFGNEIFSDTVLRGVVGLKAGEILNRLKLENGLAMVQQLYIGDGYIYNEFSPYEMVSEDDHVISYRMTIAERPRAHIEKITIKGLVKTKEFVVLRELPFKEGDVFSHTRVMSGLRRLNMLGIFKSVDRKIQLGSAPGLMNLVIVVEEGRSTDIQFGVNFSESIHDELPMHFFLEWKEKNLLGNGQHLSVGTEVNGSTQRVSMSFRERWLNEKPVSIGTSFGFEHNKRSMVFQDQSAPVGSGLPDPYEGNYYFTQDIIVDGISYAAGEQVPWNLPTSDEIDDYSLMTGYDYYTYMMGEPLSSDFLMKYTRFSFFAGVDAGYTWNTDGGPLSLSSGITFSLEKNIFDKDVYRPLDTWLQENNDSWAWTNRWTTKLTLDNRNHAYHPTDGYLFKQVFTYVGGILMGSTHYNKSRTTVEYYKTLFNIPVGDKWSYKTVIAMHSSLHLFFDQFFIEKDPVTGRPGDAIGTEFRREDKLYTDRMNIMRGWDNQTNLEAIWENWIELRMPIYEQFVWADLFFEMTGIWSDIKNMAPDSYQALADNFFFTLGAGFRLTLDGFPIAVYVTKGFQVQYADGAPYARWQKGQYGNKDNLDERGFNIVFRLMYSY